MREPNAGWKGRGLGCCGAANVLEGGDGGEKRRKVLGHPRVTHLNHYPEQRAK